MKESKNNLIQPHRSRHLFVLAELILAIVLAGVFSPAEKARAMSH